MSESIESLAASLDKGAALLAEAAYGYRYVSEYLGSLDDQSRVLEIGSGPGLLLNRVAQDHPHLSVEGIEPFGVGFAFFDRFVQMLVAHNPNLSLHQCHYEDFAPEQQFDFIYSVNVVEHVPSWRDFFSHLKRWLTPSGCALILCPNYGFPYESHVGIPIIFSKSLTYRLFKAKIHSYELDQDCAGLWESLNFLTYSKVRKYCSENALELQLRPEICLDLVARLEHEPEFRKRQSCISLPARLLAQTGILEYAIRARWIARFLPYMQLEIRRALES